MLIATTDRLLVRHATQDDAPFILELLNTPGWLRFIGNRNVTTIDDALAYLSERMATSYGQYGHGLNTVTLMDGTPIGLCGLLKRDSLPQVDIGFAFLPEFNGKGYAYESAAVVLQHAHDNLGFQRVLAITDQDNIASINLLTKLGFVLEGLVQMPGEQHRLNLFAKEWDKA